MPTTRCPFGPLLGVSNHLFGPSGVHADGCQLAYPYVYGDMGSPYGAIPHQGGEEWAIMGSQMAVIRCVFGHFWRSEMKIAI